MDTNFLIVFCTYPKQDGQDDQDVNDNIKRANTLINDIVVKKLAACVNRITNIQSSFIWQGNLNTESEELWIIKTSKAIFPKLCEYIKAHHPYECPEIIAIPIICGNKKYLTWLDEQLEITK